MSQLIELLRSIRAEKNVSQEYRREKIRCQKLSSRYKMNDPSLSNSLLFHIIILEKLLCVHISTKQKWNYFSFMQIYMDHPLSIETKQFQLVNLCSELFKFLQLFHLIWTDSYINPYAHIYPQRYRFQKKKPKLF